MKFHKRAAPQDDSVAEGTNFAPQSLLQQGFAFLSLDNLLRLARLNGRRTILPALRTFQIQELAIRSFNLLSTRALRQTQERPDPFQSNLRTPDDRFRITAVTIFLGILT